MKLYEGLFILAPELSPETQKTQIDNVENLVRKFGGTVSEKIDLGRKSLGYPLKKFREGACWAVNFSLDSVKSPELRKALELDETLLKYLITVKEIIRTKVKKAAAPKPAAAGPVKPHSEPRGSSPAAAHSH